MKQLLKHSRLQAFFLSKVLNSMMIVLVVSLMAMGWCKDFLMPAICGSTALLLFIVYSLWLWIKKPASIVINRWLSNMCSLFVLYFLIVTAMKAANQWWYIFPVVTAVVLLFVAMVSNHDEVYKV